MIQRSARMRDLKADADLSGILPVDFLIGNNDKPGGSHAMVIFLHPAEKKKINVKKK